MSQQNTKRRRSSAIVTVILAVALVLTGTLAWQAISQKAVNNVGGEITPAGARLHDDFALEDNPDFTQPLNKDVYVENYSGQNPANLSDVGEPVYVRVKLTEYMEMGAGAGLFTLSGDDPSDYQTLDQVDANGTRVADSNNKAVSLVSGGSILDLKTWRTHIEDEASNPFAPYWSWTMGGSKAFMPTFNKDNTSLLTDRTDYAQNKFTVGDTQTASANYASDLYDDQSETHTAKNTLTTAGIVSMTEWKALGSPMDKDGLGYWVGDSDGWYYWSKGLAAGEATALLIDTISLTGTLEGEFYYGIHVTSQMATGGDWGDKDAETGFYDDGLTDDGRYLLDQAAGLIDTYSIEIEQVQPNGNNTVMQGKTIDYKATVKKTNRAQGERQAANQNVTWELEGGPYASGTAVNTADPISTAIRLTAGSTEAVGNRITLKATSEEGGAIGTIDVTVIVRVPTLDDAGEGESFTSGGVDWIVLAEEDDTKLIMTKHVYGYGTQYNKSGSWNHLDTDGNTLKTALETFYTSNVGADLKSVTVAYKSPLPDVRNAYNDGAGWNAAEKDEAGKSHPDTATVVETDGSNAIFVLSLSEAHYYLGDATDGKIAYDVKGTAREWWLRSPGNLDTRTAYVYYTGTVASDRSAAGTGLGFRPAFWVKSAP